MYTVAITPITVGSFAAYADTRALHIPTLLIFLMATICIIAWLNLSNDVFDFDTGIDVHKRESVVILCGGTRSSRNGVLFIANIFLSFAFGALIALSRTPLGLDFTILAVMGVAVFGGYAYQCPPFRLGYYGLGEPICFMAWALGVCAAYYSQLAAQAQSNGAPLISTIPTVHERLQFLFIDQLMSSKSCLAAAAALVAYPTSMILFCSHFHQEEDDRRAGKRSPIVRLGTKRAKQVLSFALASFVILHFALYSWRMLPWPVLVLTIFASRHVWQLNRFVSQNYSVPSVIRAAKYYAVKLHFIHGMWVSAGLFISGRNGIGR